MDSVGTRPRWLPELVANVALSSGVGYLAAAYTASRWLTRPTRRKPRHTPAELGFSWEPVRCRTADGLRLAGWVVEPRVARGTVALFHGIHGSRDETLSRTAFLVAAGYRCLAFDHRAHGESGGRRTSFGFYEGRDVAAVLNYARGRWPHQRLAALGISMGAAAICFAAGRKPSADAVILESLYHDLDSAFASRMASTYPGYYRRLTRGIIWVTERRLRLHLHQIAPCDHIADLAPAPVLLLTGTRDAHAPPTEAQRLFDRCTSHRELWLVPGARHKDVFEVGGPAYERRVLAFLDRWLRIASPAEAG